MVWSVREGRKSSGMFLYELQKQDINGIFQWCMHLDAPHTSTEESTSNSIIPVGI